MTAFQRGNVALDHAAESHDFERMSAHASLMVIAQSHEKKEPGQECDDDDANGGSRQKFEMKMLRAEKPGNASPEKSSGVHCVVRLAASVCVIVKFRESRYPAMLFKRDARPQLPREKSKISTEREPEIIRPPALRFARAKSLFAATRAAP